MTTPDSQLSALSSNPLNSIINPDEDPFQFFSQIAGVNENPQRSNLQQNSGRFGAQFQQHVTFFTLFDLILVLKCRAKDFSLFTVGER